MHWRQPFERHLKNGAPQWKLPSLAHLQMAVLHCSLLLLEHSLACRLGSCNRPAHGHKG